MRAYFAMLWNPNDSQADEYAKTILEKTGRYPSLEFPGLRLCDLSERPRASSLIPVHHGQKLAGIVYGTVFERADDPGPYPSIRDITGQQADRLTETEGRAIITDMWGKYVAFLKTPAGHIVIADPTSALPCFHTTKLGVTFVFSHLEKCSFLGLSTLTVNRSLLTVLLGYDKIQNGQTAINEVYELLGGQRLRITSGRAKTDLVWDPREFAKDVYEPDQAIAAHQLRQTTLNVVKAWGDEFEEITVSVSGGLDSSIVLSCLAGTKRLSPPLAVHLKSNSDDPGEENFAALAAQNAGAKFSTAHVAAQHTLPEPKTHPLSAKPHRSFIALDYSPLLSGDGMEATHAVFTGEGGDHLFGHSKSAFGFVDYLRRHPFGKETLAELAAAARLSQRSIWAVFARGAPFLFGKASYNPMQDYIASRQTLISKHHYDASSFRNGFPEWFLEPGGLPPGKFEQVCGLFHLFQVREMLDRTGSHEIVHPLVSQPLIEMCLRMPVYLLCHNGRSRALARTAFSGLIPEEIRTRMTKGITSLHFMDYISANRERIHDALANGELAKSGLIDAKEVNRFFAQDRYRLQPSGRMLLIYYTIEAWLRRWNEELVRHSVSTA